MVYGRLQRFSEGHIKTDSDIGAGSTKTKTIGIGFRIGIVSGRKRNASELDRENTAPADIRDRIDDSAFAVSGRSGSCKTERQKEY